MAASFIDVLDIEVGESLANARIEAALQQELPIRLGGGGESAGHLTPSCVERADHLAERGVLAADRLDIAHPEPVEGQWRSLHESSR